MLRFKVGFVTVLSCLALILGMFSSAGVASAHSTQARQSNASTVATDQDRSRCRTFVMVRERFNRFEDEDTGRFFSNETFFGGRHGVFVFGRHRREFHPVVTRFFERVTIVTICHGHRSERSEIRPF